MVVIAALFCYLIPQALLMGFLDSADVKYDLTGRSGNQETEVQR